MASPAAPAVATGAAAAAPDLVSAESTAFDLDAHRAAKTAKPAPAAARVDDDELKDEDLAAAVDEIEKPADDETVQQRAERMARHRVAGHKSSKTRYKNQRDEARTKLTAAEAELVEWRTGKRTHQASAPAPAASPVATKSEPAADPSKGDPKPTLKDFPLEKFNDEDDPFEARAAALAEALGRWAARDERRQAEEASREARQREQGEARARDLETAADKSEADAKTRYADYDAVVQAARFDQVGQAKGRYVNDALLDLGVGAGVYGDLVYHLSKDPARMNAILALDRPPAILAAIGEQIAEVKAALKGKPAASPKVTPAPEPAQPVNAGAGTGAILRDPMNESGTAIDLDEVRAHRRASRR